jgi:DNA-binding XRE family transcriptional regulator
MDKHDSMINRRASEAAHAFGLQVRSRRRALAMNQDQLALATGVGRRFLIDLEAGKASCQLGRSLVVAKALGLQPPGMANGAAPPDSAADAELPDLADDGEEPNG